MSRHAQRVGHERLDDERSLEVGPHRIAVRRAFEVRNDSKRLHRGRCITRKRIRELEDSIGSGEGGVWVAVTEAPPANHVRPDILVDHRSIAHGRASQIRHRRKRVVLNVDQIAGVFRDITRVRNHDGDRLADVACLIDGDRIVGEGGLHDARQRTDQSCDVLSSDDGPNAGDLQRSREINPADPRMRMGRTQDRRKADSGNWREIVYETRLPSQERLILFTRDSGADPSLRYGLDWFKQDRPHLDKRQRRPSIASSRCMIYRTRRVATTRLTMGKITRRYVRASWSGVHERSGVQAAPRGRNTVVDELRETSLNRLKLAPRNDADPRSLTSVSHRCSLSSRHHHWPSSHLPWR